MTGPDATNEAVSASHPAELLGARQAAFAAALLDPELPVPRGLFGPGSRPSASRFDVYRNNVVASLTRVLRASFPATARLVGDEFFGAMARVYVAAAPPRSPLLFEYGAGLPDFIADFEPARSLPYLADVARIERAWVEAYHSPEACPLEPTAFARIRPRELPELTVLLHPSLRLVRSRFRALTLWRMNVEGGPAASVTLEAGGEDTLVARPDAQVELRSLAPGGVELLQALARGSSMLEATELALAAERGFDLSATLAALLNARVFVGADSPARRVSRRLVEKPR